MNKKQSVGLVVLVLLFATLACITPAASTRLETSYTQVWVEGQATNIAAQSNDINAHATAQLLDAQGNYIVNVARSTQIVADSDYGPVAIYLQGKNDGQNSANPGMGLGDYLILAIACFVAVVIVIGLFK